MERVSEQEAGIRAFLSPELGGFEGKFKEKWQDFHVHEVDSTGVELHLSELITPGLVSAELKAAATARRQARLALGPEYAPPAEVEAQLQAALGQDATTKLIAFLRSQRPAAASSKEESSEPDAKAALEGGSNEPSSASSQAKPEPPAFIDFEADKLGDGSKEARKIAHKTILESFDTLLNTETVEVDNVRQVRVWMRDAEARIKSQASGSSAQNEDRTEGKGKGKGKGKKGKGKGKGKKGKGGDGGADAPVGDFGTLRREGWPKDRPKYLYFRLYKENCNTSEAVSSIAGIVGRSPKQFSFAGTKDKRASTVQLICAKKLPADQLRRSLAHKGWDRRLRVSDFVYMPEPLRLGQLRGNRFNIVLRGVAPDVIKQDSNSESIASRAFAAVSASGFLNYFGLQRFGTREVRTHGVGAAVLAKDFAKVARLIIGECPPSAQAVPTGKDDVQAKLTETAPGKRKAESEAEDPSCRAGKVPRRDTAGENEPGSDKNIEKKDLKVPKWQQIKDAARLYLEGGDVKAALQAMPRSQHLERCVLGAIDRGLRGEEVLRQLPHQALSLYVHAAQSIVWNAVLSRRIAEFGTKPVVGDLVLANKATGDEAELGGAGEDMIDGDDCMLAEAEQEDGSDAEDEDVSGSQLPEVRELTEADVSECAGLFDVVLPLPGYGVRYPSRIRSYYEEAAQELLGVGLDEFHEATLVPLRGAYRAAVVRPADLSWKPIEPDEVARAEANRQPLQQTDVARLLEVRGEVPGQAAASQDNADPMEVTPCAPPVAGQESSSAAVAFSCVLPPSAYLTMLLREVMKLSTASPQLLG